MSAKYSGGRITVMRASQSETASGISACYNTEIGLNRLYELK